MLILFGEIDCVLRVNRFGAAVVSDTVLVPSVVSQSAYNPLCVFQYINDTLPPDEWENVRLC